MLTEEECRLIAESQTFTDEHIRKLVDTLATKLTRNEYLALDAILDGTDFELVEAVREKAAELDPDSFTQPDDIFAKSKA